MVIENVHGLQATSISLNDRFTTLIAAAPKPVVTRPRRRLFLSTGFFPYNLNFKDRLFIDQIAWQLELRAKRRASMLQRLGLLQENLRRFNSESNLSNLRRLNSNLCPINRRQQSVKHRVAWRQFNGNLRRATSFGSLVDDGGWRGLRRRGVLRGSFRGGRQTQGRVARVTQKTRVARGRGQARAVRGAANGFNNRGARQRNQQQNNPVPTREELDAQLDQYMAGAQALLDKELDEFMKKAMKRE